MTAEELIQAFPECEKIKREDIAECITKAMTEERFYAEASDKIYSKAYELWPYQRGLKDDDPERVAYKAYFWGDILKGVRSRNGRKPSRRSSSPSTDRCEPSTKPVRRQPTSGRG